MKKINVLVVDDSAVARQVITQSLREDSSLRVMGAAQDPLFAMQHMRKEWPDVIVLDIEMPRMDGITFLKKIMAERPTPVVICSTLTEKGARATIDALAAGAVGIITKAKAGLQRYLEDHSNELVVAVKAAAQANLKSMNLRATPSRTENPPALQSNRSIAEAPTEGALQTTEQIVAIGTSTGGTQALEVVLSTLPRVCPGIVIVQHMPEKFTAAFAQRLNSVSEVEVREAQHQDRILPGLALIAPGGKHMAVKRSGAQYQVDVFNGPLVNRHRPSVDVMFRSVAKSCGANALGIIMTGMGDDGAAGLKEILEAGGSTIGQDAATCVVYGMPAMAAKRGAVQRELPLERIACTIMEFGYA